MERWSNSAEWAEQVFGQVQLGNISRTRRLVKAATAIADRPQGSLPSRFDWNELRAVYRVMNRPEATHQSVTEPYFRQVRQEMARHPVVLIVHDTTHLDFTSHRALKGTGPIGWGGRGFLQHNSLAVVPEGRLLGLAYQQARLRRRVPKEETAAQRRRRERESQMWKEGVEGVGPAPEGALWVDVADRGADIFDMMELSRRRGHHFLIRASQNRKVLVGPPGKEREESLFSQVRSLAPQATGTLPIGSRGGREGREARLALAAEEMRILPPWPESRRRDARPAETVWVERIWEPDPPPGCKALEWVLLSSLPVRNEEDLKTRQDWYALRWPVAEDFHQVEKTGCGEEQLRFETAEAMQPMLAVLSITAVRILQLRNAARETPDAPAEQVATSAERQLVASLLAKKKRATASKMTIRDFVHAVAGLGGFLGRKGDGSPGWKTLWRGYQRLKDMVAGAELLTTTSQKLW